MKIRRFASLLIGVCLCLAATAVRAQVRIMPFGDSVTARGSMPESSYRYWLWTYLQKAKFDNIAFVGNQYGVSDGTPANGDFDQHYEGGSAGSDAWTTQDALDDAPSAASEQPDIVLLDFGSNDVIGGADLSTITANLEQIIETFRAANPNVIILLAQPTPWVTSDKFEKNRMSKLRGAVSQAAKVEKRAGARVVLVDLGSGFRPKTETKDGTHPTVRGEQKIAKRFFGPLRNVLRRNF